MSAVCQRTERSTDRNARGVVDLMAVRTERLVPGIVYELRVRGTAVADLDGSDAEAWRRAARLAGRELGLRVRTGVNQGRAWVTSDDWVAPPGSDRRAANLFAALLSGTRPLGRVVPLRRS